MKKVDIISNIVARKGEALATPSKDISKVNLSGYLLKSIWDKVFEIRTDSQGTEYIFGKLPMVTQYGITMYSGDGVDIPSLASGLPFDGRTIWYNPDTQQIEVIGGTGGGSGEGVSNFWDLSGIPSWITNSKPKYTYTEIEGTPDLSGYATESWVLGKSYITSATLGTELGKYVTLDTDQPLKGKKDFKNGLSIDGLEIRKSQDDVVYIDANLVVRGGVTMYAQNEVNIPPIIDSIPTASTTVKGIASFDGAYFSVVNGKVSLIASNVGLNEEELYNYLTSNNYAKKSDIPSLVGYATQSWVENKKYLTAITSAMVTSALGFTPFNSASFTKSNIKSTLGISDWALAASKPSYTTSEVSEGTNLYFTNARAISALTETLKAYVTLGGTQTITGEKNFTGGLKVNGSPIYYDTEKKYWKLEGDLLVTGGVTMYGSDSSFTPSTIMDAIAVDGTTISKSGGVLKVIGGTGGGVADSVAWGNITGKPTFATVATSGKYSDLSGVPTSLPASDVYSWAKSATKPTYTWSEITSKPTWIGSSKPSYSYSEITGAISTTELQNYLTQNSYLNVTSGDNRYLKLSGGTINSSFGGLEIKRNNTYASAVKYSNTSGVLGYIGFNDNFNPMLWDKSKGELGVILHSGNIGEYTIQYYGNQGAIDFDNVLYNGVQYTSSSSVNGGKHYGALMSLWSGDTAWQIVGGRANEGLMYRSGNGTSTSWSAWKTIAFTDSNVASATKLENNDSYTAWGQTFFTNGKPTSVSGAFNYGHIWIHNNDEINSFVDINANTSATLYLQYRTTGNTILCYGGGNVGVGTANPLYKHHVVGDSYIQGVSYVANYISFDHKDHSINNEAAGRLGTFDRSGGMVLQFGTNTSYRRFSIIDQPWTVELFYVDDSGNVFANGGITMYSDKRKKTILNHVELSLKQIAEAPLIEHYYNSDDKKTTHVGSIAQYWASMNDWFCKLDSEGYYTMEIQNAALASAISIARELDRYETKTDKAIKTLKKRICELEEEVERLKSS